MNERNLLHRRNCSKRKSIARSNFCKGIEENIVQKHDGEYLHHLLKGVEKAHQQPMISLPFIDQPTNHLHAACSSDIDDSSEDHCRPKFSR